MHGAHRQLSRLFQHREAKSPRTLHKDRDRDRRIRDSNCPLQSVCRRQRRAIVGVTFLAQSLLFSLRTRLTTKPSQFRRLSMAARKNQPNKILLTAAGLFASENDV